MAKKSKGKIFLRVILLLFILVLLMAGGAGFFLYSYAYKPNTQVKSTSKFLYIPTGADFEQVIDSFRADSLLIDEKTFVWLAEQKNYNKQIKPGRYRIRDGMNNNALVNMLRAGLQEPVNVTFNNARTKEELAERIRGKIEADADKLRLLLNEEDYVKHFGFDTENILSMFIPNTYQMYWNTSAEQFLERMHKEYDNFWTAERIMKAKSLNMSPKEVSVLASIVQSETTKKDEKPRIAGVYINRLVQGKPLEADPTLVWAIGDFSMRRVLNKDKEIESPYNTYKYKGLPPGPICVPEISSLDAVLNYEKHNYIFFCAKEDFSGYSNFATTYAEHLKNAKKYQAALNKRKIMR